jgi:peptidoglycan/xylan/chitin deacetylase (PgdA/CDA1 family)
LSSARLDAGVFTLSLDFELIWGTLDLLGPSAFRQACLTEREEVVDQLLELLTEFEVPATWFVVGHLFLDRCYAENGRKHPEIVRPAHSWHRGDWFKHDPDGTEAEAPQFLARSLVEKIARCRVPQEIGSHSFSHVIFGDPGCSEATAHSELAASVRAAAALGITLRSLSFPRNRVGHVALLPQHGITAFRSPEPRWYQHEACPPAIRRLAHLFEVLSAATPPAVLPVRRADGLVEMPGSMIYFPAHGLRRYIPVSWRVRRARKGLEAAARERRVFHLWTHPTNLAHHSAAMVDGMRQVLEHFAALREAGRLRAMSVGALTAVCP